MGQSDSGQRVKLKKVHFKRVNYHFVACPPDIPICMAKHFVQCLQAVMHGCKKESTIIYSQSVSDCEVIGITLCEGIAIRNICMVH